MTNDDLYLISINFHTDFVVILKSKTLNSFELNAMEWLANKWKHLKSKQIVKVVMPSNI